MFGNRAIQVKMVKSQKSEYPTTDGDNFGYEKNWEDIAEVATKLARDGAIIIGGVYIATKAFNTACNIGELIIKSKLK